MRTSQGIGILVLVILLLALPLLAACGDDDETAAPTDQPTGETTPTAEPTATVESPPIDLVTYTEEREPCDCRDENRNLYWGELHAHTILSFDAHTYETRTTPTQAYEFAKGGEVALTPLDEEGNGIRIVSLSRPLDFAALTDHQEYLAEVHLCTDPTSSIYDCEFCQEYRKGGGPVVTDWGIKTTQRPVQRFPEICGQPGIDCQKVAAEVWQGIIQAAEDAYDKSSDCSFTSFVAYEYTGNVKVSNNHRNIIFRNTDVPELPPSYFEHVNEEPMWVELKETCLDVGGDCDAIAIPHNTNWSSGNMFVSQYPEEMTLEEQAELAALRAQMEPLIEIYQHKGDSECKNGFGITSNDPLCDFEKLWPDPIDCGDEAGGGGFLPDACRSRYDYLRNILNLGLQEEQRLGVNPYKLGVLAATDTHNGIPGRVEEYEFPGHIGNLDDTPEKRLGLEEISTANYINESYGAGGLTAAWAVENSRDALFESFRNRETYSTSGPRITIRFFGGWDYPADLCDNPDFVSIGYEKGVPMGGDLPQSGDVTVPTFVVWAEKDPGVEGHPGTDLQQIQIIKGWIDANGEPHEKVYTVAGDPNNGATVDKDTCATIGEGSETLCAQWPDIDFDPANSAFYYARVVENPTCSWRQYDCNELSENVRRSADICSGEIYQTVIQERAVTSPIWYDPTE